MSLDVWLHFGHVISVIVWLGGGFTLSVLAARARASGDPAAVREFARALLYFGPRVLTPAVVGTLVFGVALVLSSAAWDFGQAWVLLGLGLFVVAFAIGVGYLARIGAELGRLANAGTAPATGPGDKTPAADLLGRWILGYRLVLAVLAVIVWDMIAKPGL